MKSYFALANGPNGLVCYPLGQFKSYNDAYKAVGKIATDAIWIGDLDETMNLGHTINLAIDNKIS